MSGGVDSAVAAGLLRDQGYECVGVFMRVGVAEPDPQPTGECEAVARRECGSPAHAGAKGQPGSEAARHPRRLRHGCCSADDALDARAVAGRLGIPFYALNFEEDFARIIDYFVDEYARGRTPNPCVMCNTHLKFGKLLRYADLLDAEFVATGHYARVLRGEAPAVNGARSGGAPLAPPSEGGALLTERRHTRPVGETAAAPSAWVGLPGQTAYLSRARHLAKDQSYVLFGLPREILPRCRFPIGELADKAEVRRRAADLGLPVHDKPDSQEICFVPDHDYKRLVRQRRPDTEGAGELRDTAGRVLGTHAGVANFTIGQRHGLGIAAGRPLYVTHLDPQRNVVTVGPRDALLSTGLLVGQVNWLVAPPPDSAPRAAAVKIRHAHAPAAAWLSLRPDGTVAVTFTEPQLAVTPGQAAVFYDGELVLGGGWIAPSDAHTHTAPPA